MVTGDEGVKLDPVTVTVVPTGPPVGLSVIDGVMYNVDVNGRFCP